MELRIETTAEKWEAEYLTMIGQGFFLCVREDKIYWECDNNGFN